MNGVAGAGHAANESPRINSFTALRSFVRQDRLHSFGEPRPFRDAIGWAPLMWTMKLRLVEFLINCVPFRIVGKVAERIVQRAGIRLGYTIPPNVFGPGLSIAHWGTIVVNRGARVGPRCRIHPGVTIGTKGGGVPVIGSDCYLGAGAKVIGDVALGDRCVVGANAVVLDSFPSDSVLVGIPARRVESSRQSG